MKILLLRLNRIDNVLFFYYYIMKNKLTPKKYIEWFKNVTFQMLKITEAKNKDYSWEDYAFKNFELIEELTWWKISTAEWLLVRITDKITRVANLIHNNPAVCNESITDTLLDCANYCIILDIYLSTLNPVNLLDNNDNENGTK